MDLPDDPTAALEQLTAQAERYETAAKAFRAAANAMRDQIAKASVPVVIPKSDVPASVASVLKALKVKSMRMAELIEFFDSSEEDLTAIVENPESGIIRAKRGWFVHPENV